MTPERFEDALGRLIDLNLEKSWVGFRDTEFHWFTDAEQAEIGRLDRAQHRIFMLVVREYEDLHAFKALQDDLAESETPAAEGT